jgi:uncharacterized protein DUF1566
MRSILIVSALLLFSAYGCDVFVPSVGGDGQACAKESLCKDGLTCRNNVCCRTNWEGSNCDSCPGNWDAAQDCAACTGNWDPAQGCAACLGNWDVAQNCSACLDHWANNDDDCGTCAGNWDILQNCSGCLGNWDVAQDCNACLNQWQDNSDDCGTCPGNWDAAQDCADCVGNWDSAQGCTVYSGHWEDNSNDCGTCPGKWDETQDCAECVGNWDSAQDCTVCSTNWVDNSNDCGTCPGNWDDTQDCAECVGNWDSAQDCAVCRGNWVDNSDNCGNCLGNWDEVQDCAVCSNHWEDNSDDCGTCPANWDPGQDCNLCLAEWTGSNCEKVLDCTGQPDFTLCELDTGDHDYYYDICVAEECISPGCDQQTCNAPGPHFTLADSGLLQCFNETGALGSCPGTAGDANCATTDYCGQDFQYGWDVDPPSARYTRTEPVSDQPIVEDNVTGLIWQGCQRNLTGINCDIGFDEGAIWRSALDYCDLLDWGGFTDWHLPDEYELISIVDYNNSAGANPTIDAVAFPETPGEHFWTSSTAFGDQANAVSIGFGAGEMIAEHKDAGYHIRCVRNGPLVSGGAVGPRFTVDRSEETQPVVIDNVTGLDWQGCLDGMVGEGTTCTGSFTGHNWTAALARCQELDWGGHTDWYLPDIKQLQSISDNRAGNPAIDTDIFPGPPQDVCWSSTTNTAETTKAWVVYYDKGFIYSADYNFKTDGRALRCVRDGG